VLAVGSPSTAFSRYELCDICGNIIDPLGLNSYSKSLLFADHVCINNWQLLKGFAYECLSVDSCECMVCSE